MKFEDFEKLESKLYIIEGELRKFSKRDLDFDLEIAGNSVEVSFEEDVSLYLAGSEFTVNHNLVFFNLEAYKTLED